MMSSMIINDYKVGDRVEVSIPTTYNDEVHPHYEWYKAEMSSL